MYIYNLFICTQLIFLIAVDYSKHFSSKLLNNLILIFITIMVIVK